jgi:hypothetical protein
MVSKIEYIKVDPHRLRKEAAVVEDETTNFYWLSADLQIFATFFSQV